MPLDRVPAPWPQGLPTCATLRFFTAADFCDTTRANMSHSKAPPSLPTVVDEAGDTPTWVPILGLVLFGLAALIIAVSTASGTKNEAENQADDHAPTAAGPNEVPRADAPTP
jgi:hypothetical protein